MAYIALAVPLIHPRNGIQYYIKVPVSAKFGMLLNTKSIKCWPCLNFDVYTPDQTKVVEEVSVE